MEKTYNGWANYATWRVNLEIIDGINPQEMDWHGMPLSGLAGAIKDYVEEIVCPNCNTITESYALAFLSDVNWTEIASHMMQDYADQWEEMAA